ncbi:sn-glycerol-3-phosphate ABC transporter ATP-binding protein UgpC [soil metagenome]
MADIRLENVSKVYPSGVKAVEDVSLHIRDGEFMILLGPSGCGKSTTLRMIAGLESISAGEVHIGGRLANEIDPRDRNLAFVFQNYALYPHMTVAANLSFGLRLRHAPQEEIARRVAEAAELLGIESLLDRKPSALSGGQRQRVALGRALVRDPVAFLLDEPLSNLDAKLRAGMRRELVKLHRTLGRTIVHVTHDQVEAMTMGERICIMRDGRIVQVGEPLEVYRNPADLFVAGFLASPPMNLLQAQIDARDSRPVLRCGPLTLPISHTYAPEVIPRTDTSVVLGIRPEDIYDHEIAGGISVEVKIVAIESLGPETVVVGEIPGVAEISARIGRSFSAPIGSVQRFSFDPSQLHIFDAQTTLAIRRQQVAILG